MVRQTFALMTKLFVEDSRRLRNAMGVCLTRSGPSFSTAVGGSTGGTGTVVPNGRPLSAAADVFGVDALPNLLSFMRARHRELCSCVMCTVVNVIFSIVMRDRKNGASGFILKRSDTRYDRSPTQNDRQAAALHKRQLSPGHCLDSYQRACASAE